MVKSLDVAGGRRRCRERWVWSKRGRAEVYTESVQGAVRVGEERRGGERRGEEAARCELDAG